MFLKLCAENDYVLTDDVSESVYNFMDKEVSKKSENFANGRLVRNLYEDMTMNHARRVVVLPSQSREKLSLFTQSDFEKIHHNYPAKNDEATE